MKPNIIKMTPISIKVKYIVKATTLLLILYLKKNMDLITITISNLIKISGLPRRLETKIIQELTITNPKWLENEKMCRWNKDIPKTLHFYDKTEKDSIIIPRGYVRQLLYLVKNDKIPYQIVDNRRIFSPTDISFHGHLKDFQHEAVNNMLKKDFGTLCAPPGAGKTVMALYMISKRKQPAIIVVHTKDLAFQWIERINTFLDIPVDEIGFIKAGKHTVGKKITVALVQSLLKCTEKVAPQIGFIIVDECHRAPSRTFSEVVTAFDSKFMLGLTATPWRRDKLSKLIFWNLGGVYHEIKQNDLIKTGDIISAEIVVRTTEFTPYYDPVREYSKMLSELTTDDKRNRLIASDILQETKQNKGICLVLSDRKKHCEHLNALLRYKYNIKSALLTGDTADKKRKDLFSDLNQEKIKVLVATGQLIGEGFDCKNLSTLFLVTPIKYSGRVLQYIGRILRPSSTGQKAKVYDYVDINVNVLKSSAKARQKVYDNIFNNT